MTISLIYSEYNINFLITERRKPAKKSYHEPAKEPAEYLNLGKQNAGSRPEVGN